MVDRVDVIGGGPSGATAAIFLARNGIDVTLYEKELRKEKTCGGGVRYRAFKDFKDILEGLDFYKCRSLTFDFGKDKFDVDFKGPSVAIGRRSALDGRLRRVARDEGVKIVKKKVIKLPKDGVVVDARGFKRSERNAIVVRAYSKCEPKRYNKMLFKIDFKKLGIGYYWIFPMKGGIVNVGLGEFSGSFQSHPFILLKEFCKENGLKPYGMAASPVNVDGRIENLVSDNVIRVGESAGLVDPVTAEGIYQAMTSGRIAAECIAKDKIDDYERRVKKEFGFEFFVNRKIKEVFFSTDPSKIKIKAFKAFMWTIKNYLDSKN
jgi:flavin-dependent dehydrogenase